MLDIWLGFIDTEYAGYILFYLIISLPVMLFLQNFFLTKFSIGRASLALLNFVLIIVIYYIWIFSLEVVLERKMYQYGLEVNGWDSLGEPSEELRAAMDRWQSDTGRNFGKIFIVPFSFIYSLAFWVVLYLFDGIKKKSLKEVA